ncbi:MAG: Holliday junction resolvase RuvX [Candidatus Doudnabacteria bacterium]|nr:Holliday junction resolvase RuvX [Candidatus Doudnabacteria bacterium]
MALDWGEVRVGAAVSDPDGKIAFPLEKVIEAKVAVEEIKNIVAELVIEKIVIGLPKNLNGVEASSAKKVEEFAAELKKYVTIPIEFLDERFTSVQAGKILADIGMREAKQRQIKDNIAAQIMLQQYLETYKK